VANVKGASPDAILQAAAERFMEQQAPMALALHLYNEEPARRAEAMALTQRIARSDSDEKLSALNLIGVELLERPEKRPEDLKQAIGYFEQVIAQEPGLAMAHTNWGAALSALGDKAGATEKYREAIRLAPDEPMQHHNLGVVLAAQGKNAEAIASFEKAISLAPGYADSYMGLGGVQMGGAMPRRPSAISRRRPRSIPPVPMRNTTSVSRPAKPAKPPSRGRPLKPICNLNLTPPTR
jgi:tetratricopeptide (TPR) repeat protein